MKEIDKSSTFGCNPLEQCTLSNRDVKCWVEIKGPTNLIFYGMAIIMGMLKCPMGVIL